MQPHPLKLYLYVPMTALAAIVFVASLVHLMLPSAEAEVLPIPTPISQQREQQGGMQDTGRSLANTVVSTPDYLIIPDIGVNAKIEHVGLTSGGAMATPKSFKTVGWYQFGPRPGMAGSAVLAGHVDNALGFAGVFKRLKELQPGDVVAVQTSDGAHLRFIVKKVQSYDYRSVPAETVFDTGGTTARLNLITCDGSWIQKEKTYNQRLIVFTELET